MTISAAELLVYTRAVGAVDTQLALAALGVSVAAVGIESVKMAGDFQQSMTQLVTSAGESRNNIKAVSDGILQMSVDTATSTKQLVAGMYNIESANIHGADSLKVLKAAAEGAKAENADLAAVTDVLTTALHAYHMPASQAVDVMNSLIKTTATGKMHMDDLTQAFKNVLSIASLAKVHLTDVEAALATMSLNSDKGAIAGTHLSQMLTSLLAPSGKATKELALVGLTTQQISDEMKISLPDTIKMITDAVGEKFPAGTAKYIAALSTIVGGNKQMKAIMELSGQSLQTFIDDAKNLAPTMTANSTAVDNWSLIQSNFNFQLEAAQNAVSVLMIKLGTALLPTLGQMLTAVTPLITSFGDWIVASDGLSQVIQNSVNFYNQWQGVITTTATALTVFFIPALIKSGVEAAISAATISGKFVLSLIETGLEGWAAAGALATYIGALALVGTQAVISAAKVTYSFIAALIETGVQAYVAAYAVSGSFVVSLGMVGTQALAAAGKLLVGFIPALGATNVALDATGVAATVALGPIGVLIAIVGIAGAAFIAMKNKSDEMNLGVSGAFDTMGNQVQRSTGRIMQTADQMKTNVSNATNQLKQNVSTNMLNAMNAAVVDSQTMSTRASALWNQFNHNATASLASLDASTISYMNSIAGYIDSKSAQAAAIANENFASIHVPSFSGSAILHNFNDSSNFTGHAEGITNNPVGHWAMIGERGPEKMYIPRGASIIPNNQLNSMGSGNSPSQASSSNADRPLILQIDGRTFARVILPALTDQIRYGVGSVGI